MQDLQSLFRVVALHRAVAKRAMALDATSSSYTAGVEALVSLYDRIKAADDVTLAQLAKHGDTIVSMLCNSMQR
jgi:hypothetical protein